MIHAGYEGGDIAEYITHVTDVSRLHKKDIYILCDVLFALSNELKWCIYIYASRLDDQI